MEITNTLGLFKEARDNLRLTKIAFSGLRSLDQQSISDLNAGNWIRILDSTKPYFAPAFLKDKDNDVAYPLFFYEAETKKENGKTYIRRSNILPAFNSAALDVLESYGVDAHDISRADDWKSYELSLNSAIELRGLEDTLEVVERFAFVSEETMFYNNFYPWLKDRIAGTDLPSKFNGLFNKAGGNQPNTNQSLTSSMRGVLKKLDEDDAVKAVYHQDSVGKSFILELINDQMEKGNSVLFLYSKEDKDSVKNIFNAPGSEKYMFDFSDVDASLGSVLNTPVSEEVSLDENEKRSEIRQKRLTLAKRKKTIDAKENEIVSFIPPEILVSAKEHNAKIYPMDVSDYTVDDMKEDNEYFRMLSEMNRLPEVYSESHFVGLSCSGKRENYDQLMLTLVHLQKQLSDIKAFTEEKKLKGFDDKPINNFDAVKRYLDDVALVSGYTGFPLEMFDSDYEAENLDELEDLYKKVSSSRLMVLNLFDESIFNEDLGRLFKQISSGTFFESGRAKKTIRSHLKENANYDFDSLLTVLKTAYGYSEQLAKVLPQYEWTYGVKVNNYNGLIEVKKNLEYIRKVKNYEKRHPYFSFENLEVQNCLNNKDVLTGRQNTATELQEFYKAFINSSNSFIGMFLDLKVPYTFMTFDELADLFGNIQKGKYEEFEEYARMKDGSTTSSIQAQLITKKCNAEERTSTERTESFYLSLVTALRKERKEKSAVFNTEYETNEEEFVALTANAENVLLNILFESIERNASARCDSIRFQDAYKTLKLNYKNNNLTYDDYENRDYILSCLYPFSLAKSGDILSLGEESIDLTIIYDSAEFSIPVLVKAILMSKKVVFIESASSFDNRTQGYPTVSVSSETIYSDATSGEIGPELLGYINRYFGNFGYSVTTQGDAFPCTVVDSEGVERFALGFDEYIEEDECEDVYINLPVFMQACYGIDLIIINIDDLIVDPQDTILAALEKVTLKKLG